MKAQAHLVRRAALVPFLLALVATASRAPATAAQASAAPALISSKSASGSSAQANPNATRRLRQFLDADWKYWVREYPENATLFGYPGENGQWTDYSAAAIERRNQHLRQSLVAFDAIPRSELPGSEQLNYDLYRKELALAIEGLKFHGEAFPLSTEFPTSLLTPVNQMAGVQQAVPETIAQMPTETAADYRDIISRLNGIPALMDQITALMKQGIAIGWTPPKIIMRDVAAQAGAQVVANPLDSPMLVALKRFPASITPAEQQQLTRDAVAAYTTKASPAFAKFRDFLANTYVPACRDSIAAGGLPAGADYYKYLVRWETTTALTPAEIHETGLAQVKQIHTEMNQVIEQTGFKGSFADFIKFVNTDKQFVYPSADDMLLHYRALAKEVDPQLADLFGLLPRLPYGVKVVPEAIGPSQTTAYYEPGSVVARRPGYLFVNVYNLPARPTWAVEDLVLHESVPGHHLQIALAQEMQGVPEFRKQLGFTAYVEGWGLYAESLGPQLGFYADPYSKFGYLSAQMWRAVRLVVDTGMHSMGWSRDEALKYFEENTGQPEQNSIAEVDRYIVWPGQALAYKIGQLKILELRHDAEQQLGARFDIRAFHDEVLDEGSLPLDILEARVKEWIAAQKARPAGATK